MGYSMDLRKRIVAGVKEEGLSISEIARRFSVSRPTIYEYLEKAEQGDLQPNYAGGRKSKLSPELQTLVAERAEQRDTTLQEHCDWLLAEYGISLDPSNLSRLFKSLGVSWKKRA